MVKIIVGLQPIHTSTIAQVRYVTNYSSLSRIHHDKDRRGKLTDVKINMVVNANDLVKRVVKRDLLRYSAGIVMPVKIFLILFLYVTQVKSSPTPAGEFRSISSAVFIRR